MQVQIKKWGNSAGVRLPQAVLAQFGLKENDHFEMQIQADSLILKPAKKRKYHIQELTAEMNDSLPMVDGWDEMVACGKEQ